MDFGERISAPCTIHPSPGNEDERALVSCVMGRSSPLSVPVFLLLASSVMAQPQESTWYFGNQAGLSFNGGAPVAFSGCAANTFEASASISSASGMGLFYCDGENVYDRSNNLMPNGTGLYGGNSSAQGALFVPFPGDTLHYYLFTLAAQIGQGSLVDYMTYSVIDRTLHNRYGDVTLKNVPLVHFPTEQMSATYHANGHDVWVLVRIFGTDQWYAYLVTCNGLAGPVISHAGRVVQDSNPNDTQACLGSMDITYDGARIASTWNDYPTSTSYLELLHFDNATGVVSDGTYTTHVSTNGSNTAYGCSFSPSGSALYWSEYGYPNSRLSQFNMSVADPFSTELLIAENTTLFAGLQLGPDGRLYMSRWDGSQYIARIDQPDVIGTGCGFVLDGVFIAPGYGSLNLPNDWMPPTTPIDLIAWTDTSTCATPLTIALTWNSGADPPDILWSTGGTGSSTQVSASGTYTVMAIWPCDTVRDTVHVVLAAPQAIDVLPDTVRFCEGEEVEVSGPAGFAHYLWSTGAITPSINTGEEGLIVLRMEDEAGCAQSDTVALVLSGCACDVFVPNVFTPNRDGINESFQEVTTCAFRNYSLSIFNRWGERIWTTTDPESGWDGGNAPDGVYVWALHYDLAHARTPQRKDLHGMVTLLR